MKNIIIIFIVLIQYGCANDKYYYKNNQKINLVPINKASRDIAKIDYYQNNKGIVLGVTNKLIVKLKNHKDLKKILNAFNLTLEKTLSKNLYLLKTTNKNSTINTSNRLSEKEYVEYSHPDFIKRSINR